LFQEQILSPDCGDAKVGSKLFAGAARIGEHQFRAFGNRGRRIEGQALFQLGDAGIGL